MGISDNEREEMGHLLLEQALKAAKVTMPRKDGEALGAALSQLLRNGLPNLGHGQRWRYTFDIRNEVDDGQR